MIRRLLAWFREPKEPLGRGRHRASPHPERSCDRTCNIADAAHGYGGVFVAEMPVPAVPHVDAARPAADLPAAPEHVGATEQFGAELAAMRHALDDDLAHGVTALDPEQRAQELADAAWEEAFARAEGVIDMEAARMRRRVDDTLDRMAPGWRDTACEPILYPACPRCVHKVHDFGEAMAAAGVIALPAEPVDYSTAEYRLVTA